MPARRAEPQLLAEPDAALRILLCHFPGIARRIPADAFHLILAGHYHAGQIVVPLPGGKLNLAHPRIRDVQGLFRYGTSVLARVSRPRHHVRPVSLLRPARGHRAGCTIVVVMERRPLISADVLARYAADAALGVSGVAGLANGPLNRGKSVSVSGDEDTLAIELNLELEWGQSSAEVGKEVQRRVSEYLERMANVSPASVEVVVGAVEPAAAAAMTSRLAGLTGATLETTPAVCQSCVWWQTRGNREPEKRKWVERAESEWGAWGTVYRDDDGRVLGSMQYGPAQLFPRAADLPAGPASDDAVLVTCAYLLSDSQPWVEQSLFLAAIGETRDKGVRALEAFAYRYREGTPPAERFLVHRTVFPRDFLADFGFRTLRSAGRIELARLELGGLQPVEEGTREKVLQVVKDAFQPAPAPAPPG